MKSEIGWKLAREILLHSLRHKFAVKRGIDEEAGTGWEEKVRVPSRHFHSSHTKSLEMFTRLFHIWTSIDRNSSRRCIVESTLKSQREKWFRPEPDFIFHFGDYARMESHLPSRNKGAGSGKRLFLPLTEHHVNGASRMSTLESVKSFLRSKRKDFSPNFT